MKPYKKNLEVAAAVIFNRFQQVLVCQRVSPESLRGLWEFPGGKLEQGENPRQAVHRELAEELELSTDYAFMDSFSCFHAYDNFDVQLYFFLFQTAQDDTEVKSRVHQATQWAKVTELDNYPFLEGNKTCIDFIKKRSW